MKWVDKENMVVTIGETIMNEIILGPGLIASVRKDKYTIDDFRGLGWKPWENILFVDENKIIVKNKTPKKVTIDGIELIRMENAYYDVIEIGGVKGVFFFVEKDNNEEYVQTGMFESEDDNWRLSFVDMTIEECVDAMKKLFKTIRVGNGRVKIIVSNTGGTLFYHGEMKEFRTNFKLQKGSIHIYEFPTIEGVFDIITENIDLSETSIMRVGGRKKALIKSKVHPDEKIDSISYNMSTGDELMLEKDELQLFIPRNGGATLFIKDKGGIHLEVNSRKSKGYDEMLKIFHTGKASVLTGWC